MMASALSIKDDEFSDSDLNADDLNANDQNDSDLGDRSAELVAQANVLQTQAAKCDAMCLTSGTRLSEAVPGIYELSSQFASLSSMLDTGDGLTATKNLEQVASDIVTIGSALASERDAVNAMITLNGLLTHRIEDLVHDVRFLSAVVSNVKIEIASINEDNQRLDGFADNLRQLTSRSEATLNLFQDTHQKLVGQLQRTSKAQSAFVLSHGAKLVTASQEIIASLESVSNRRRTIAGVATEIGKITQKIGTQIAQSVMAMQIGDSTRQRLEHVGESLLIAAGISIGDNPAAIFGDEGAQDTPANRAWVFALICALQSLQTTHATAEFGEEIATIGKLLEQITDASVALVEKSSALVSSPSDPSAAFLTELEAKLASAGDLIDECGRSRKSVDATAASAVATVLELEGLAKDVAAMAIDMTIIGTNAAVTSFRLGTKGVALRIIAQHLRTHALGVTDAVKRVRPALGEVLASAKRFTSARESQDAKFMEGLAATIASALASFKNGEIAMMTMRQKLDTEVATVGGVLRHSRDALQEIDAVKAELTQVAATLEEVAEGKGDIEEFSLACGETPASSLGQLLYPRYTMGSERTIHNTFFATSTTPAAVAEEPAEDDMWL